MNTLLAVLCLSALTQQPGLTIAARCDAPLATGTTIVDKTLPVAVAPVETSKTEPKPQVPISTHKAAVQHHCSAGKHSYYHRRGLHVWWTCA